MARNQKDFTFDYATQLKDAGLVAATAVAQVGGADKILDVGASRIDGRVILDFSAIEAASNDESYLILLQGSTSSTFAGTTHKNLAATIVGDPTVCFEGVDSPVGRREMAFCNEINGVAFRYLRIKTVVAGTIATGVNFTAFVVQEA